MVSPAADGATALDVSSDAQPPAWAVASREFRAWREGETEAFDRLVRLLTPTLWHLARANGIPADAADDVVQTTWASLVRAAATIRDPKAVWRWLTTTARRESWRAARTHRREDCTDVAVLDTTLPPTASPEDDVVDHERARCLWAHVASLDRRCQRLLRVIAFDDRPDYAALSAELGMAVGGIGPTRGRCLGKLRNLIDASPERRPA